MHTPLHDYFCVRVCVVIKEDSHASPAELWSRALSAEMTKSTNPSYSSTGVCQQHNSTHKMMPHGILMR